MSTLTTISGWVGANPVLAEGKNGSQFTTIRVATTDRYRNADQEWVDGPTQWFAVRLFGEFAQNAAASIRRSDPVIVTGRFVLDAWETDEKSGSSLVLYASAIGHDLSKGRTHFTRVVRGQEVVPGDDQGEQKRAPGAADQEQSGATGEQDADALAREARRFEVAEPDDATGAGSGDPVDEHPSIAVTA